MSPGLAFALMIIGILVALPAGIAVVAIVVRAWGRWADWCIDRIYHRSN